MGARAHDPEWPSSLHGELDSPLLHEDVLVSEMEEEHDARAEVLEAESPFVRALEGERAPAERERYRNVPQDAWSGTEAYSPYDTGEWGEAAEGEDWADETVFNERALSPDEELAGETDEIDWETVESEDQQIPADIAAFAERLGREWSNRANGKPTSEAKTQELLNDYRDTLAGAQRRFKNKYSKEAIGRAWMTSREEQMQFSTASSQPMLRNFAAPTGVTLVSSPLIGSSNVAPVAPLLVRFVEDLRQRYRGSLDVSNYRGHGGLGFLNRGHSLDLFLKGRDARGFYGRDEALKLLRAIDESARAVDARWRVIYNDFAVADAINRATGQRNVIFVGTPSRDKNKRVTGLNWHGPHPLILHFHLDLAPGRGAEVPGPSPKPVPPPPRPAPSPGTPAELVRFAQSVLNFTEGERLTVDGVSGPLTRAAVDRFRKRAGLGSGSELDATIVLALAQRALEELAQQSMFAPGVRDAKTEQALINFKSQRGLAPNATVDAATRAALVAALQQRGGPRPRTVESPSAPSTPSVQGTTDWSRVPPEQRMAHVMRLLVDQYGYPVNSAAGIAGNLWEESGVLPNRIEGSSAATPMRAPDFGGVATNFTPEQVMNRNAKTRQGPRLPGIGLAQWTSANRRAGLFRHSFQGQVLGTAILESMEAQVDYLVNELRTSYRTVDARLRNPATSLEAASDEVVYNFEVPGSVIDPTTHKRRPREHPEVQRVFERRRRHARNALNAYRGATTGQREALFGDETMFEGELAGAARPVLRDGSRGDAVRELQYRLRAIPGAPIKADGVFSAETREAVVRFQERHGLQPNGVVDRRTWDILVPVSGGAPVQDGDVKRIVDAIEQARKRFESRDYQGALRVMSTVYADPVMGDKPELRAWIAFNIASSQHRLRQFPAAISRYLEAISAPGGMEDIVPLGLERIREARLGLVPTPLGTLRNRRAGSWAASGAKGAGEAEGEDYLAPFGAGHASPQEWQSEESEEADTWLPGADAEEEDYDVEAGREDEGIERHHADEEVAVSDFVDLATEFAEPRAALEEEASVIAHQRGYGWRMPTSQVMSEGETTSDFSAGEVEREILGTDDRILVSDTSAIPFRFVCCLDLLFAHPTNPAITILLRGSGTLVSDRHVLTCAHNVLEDLTRLGFPTGRVTASQIFAAPGRNGRSLPFGRSDAITMRVSPQWSAARDSQFDFALLTLRDALGAVKHASLGNRALGFWGHLQLGGGTRINPLEITKLRKMPVNLSGYPSDKCLDQPSGRGLTPAEAAACTGTVPGSPVLKDLGSTQWRSFGAIVDPSPATEPRSITYDLDAATGHSGGPVWLRWLDFRNLVAVNTGGFPRATPPFDIVANMGVRITPDVLKQLRDWMKADGVRAAF